MPSRVEALIRNFHKTEGDALCLVIGERMFLKRSGVKTVVGREPLSIESFRAIADELVPGELVDSLVESGHRLPYRLDENTDEVEIEFGLTSGVPTMTVVRTVPLAPKVAAAEPFSGGYAAVPPPGAQTEVSSSYGMKSPQQGRASSEPPAFSSFGAFASAPLGDASSLGSAAGAGSGIGAPSPARPASATSASGAGTSPAPRSASASAASPAATAPAPARPAARSAPGSGASGGGERAIDRILVRMLGDDASDLHISSGNLPCFRVHGEIVPQTDMAELTSDDVEQLLEPMLPQKYREEFEERNDTDFAYEIPGVSRFRVNIFRDRRGVGAVFRQIPIEVKTAAQLNLPAAVVGLGDLSKGLVLVTGPTGSGKSTTLAAIIDHVNSTRPDHIITIEDPIEFVHPNKKCLVNQREIGTHTKGFRDALRAALREDPDIVLVGEMRDLETIAIAIETAETGHLVFGTLHTMTAASTVDRIVDQFPEDRQAQIRVMLADALRGVVSQTLLKKKGGGRVAALEILLSNGAVANLIRDGKTFQLQSVMQTAKAQGMVMLNDALLDLVKRGVVEPKEAYQKAVDKLTLLAAMKAANIPLGDLKAEGGPAAPAAQPAAAGR